MLEGRKLQRFQPQSQELPVQSEEALFALYAGLLATSFSPYLLHTIMLDLGLQCNTAHLVERHSMLPGWDSM